MFNSICTICRDVLTQDLLACPCILLKNISHLNNHNKKPIIRHNRFFIIDISLCSLTLLRWSCLPQ